MQNMSFFLTTEAYLNGSKDVTRRNGWKNIQVGKSYMAVLKGQGLKKGDKITYLGEFQVISHRWERLDRMIIDRVYGLEEVKREGFPDKSPEWFVEMFCKSHKGCTPESLVHRIEFRKVKS